MRGLQLLLDPVVACVGEAAGRQQPDSFRHPPFADQEEGSVDRFVGVGPSGGPLPWRPLRVSPWSVGYICSEATSPKYYYANVFAYLRLPPYGREQWPKAVQQGRKKAMGAGLGFCEVIGRDSACKGWWYAHDWLQVVLVLQGWCHAGLHGEVREGPTNS